MYMDMDMDTDMVCLAWARVAERGRCLIPYMHAAARVEADVALLLDAAIEACRAHLRPPLEEVGSEEVRQRHGAVVVVVVVAPVPVRPAARPRREKLVVVPVRTDPLF